MALVLLVVRSTQDAVRGEAVRVEASGMKGGRPRIASSKEGQSVRLSARVRPCASVRRSVRPPTRRSVGLSVSFVRLPVGLPVLCCTLCVLRPARSLLAVRRFLDVTEMGASQSEGDSHSRWARRTAAGRKACCGARRGGAAVFSSWPYLVA